MKKVFSAIIAFAAAHLAMMLVLTVVALTVGIGAVILLANHDQSAPNGADPHVQLGGTTPTTATTPSEGNVATGATDPTETAEATEPSGTTGATEGTAPPNNETTPSEPAPTEPAPTEPTPTETEATAPAPTEPAPTEPPATKPAPTEPTPTEPAPTEPAPTEPPATDPPATLPADDPWSRYVGPADPETGISWDGVSPIIYTYKDGTTGTEPKPEAEYERFPGGFAYLPPDTTPGEVYDGYCEYCGKEGGDGTNGTCLRFWRGGDHTCEHCGVVVPQDTCHTCAT